MARLGQALALTMVAVACGTPSDPGFDLITETAGSDFALEETPLAVPFTVTNLSDRTIYYLDNCADRPSVAIDRHEGGRWVNLQAAICPGVLQGPPLRLHPAQDLPSFVVIRGPGVYRLHLVVFVYRLHEGVSRVAGQQTLTSNTFVVR